MTATAARPIVGALTVLNGASFGNEPSTTKAIAPNSIAVALGGALSFTTVQAQKQPDGSFPTTLGGTTVTVNNRSANRQPAPLSEPKLPLRHKTAGRRARSDTLLVGSTPSTRAKVHSAGHHF